MLPPKGSAINRSMATDDRSSYGYACAVTCGWPTCSWTGGGVRLFALSDVRQDAELRESAMRKITMASLLKCCWVGAGRPRYSPVFVPDMVSLATTWSPSATSSSTLMRRSGKPCRSSEFLPWLLLGLRVA